MQTSVPGYRITQELFVGEHVSVFRAVRDSDGESVILKQLTDAAPDAATLSRFVFSVEVGNKFDHPNIVKTLGWIGVRHQGERLELATKGNETGKPTIVLQDKQGVDLFAYLKQCPEGVLPLTVFLDIAVQLAEALSVIHYQQVIHKDLHPGNILYSPAIGLAQITDFGLSSLLSREQPTLQPPERIEGVLAYISPEQTGRMNRALDYRSDFYTLGCTFYHLLSGHPPFQASDALGLVHAHIAKQQTPLHQLRDEVPLALSAIIDRLMNKTAEDRYQSALGLKKDLEKVRNALAQNKPVPDFPLGMEDISDRLQIPQKLYGREKEIERLLQGFFQAAGGKPRMLAIAGYSGIGKSALVHEVHKPIAAYSGFFCAGKFDQFQKNIPYSALQTALKGWIQNTLSLPEAKLQGVKTQLLDALGSNARVLIDFMPDFAWVLGELPAVAQLGADETQNRLHLVFQRFIKEITREHPLVLFIDDIQWADRGTLNLLPLLMSEERCRLLVLVAYRDNEVDDNHPAMMALRQIQTSAITAHTLDRITLGPLAQPEVARLLEDALHRPQKELQPLVQLVHAKTAGNPFFIGEFLKTLYTEKLLNFDLQQQRWRWDIAAIDAKGIADNVVDLMLGKMALLPVETQTMIQLAACVGSRFSLEVLAKIAEQPLATVTRCLWPALRDGLLLQDGGDWFLGMVQSQRETADDAPAEGPVLTQFSPVSPQCRFLHDRMLQAAYQSMSLAKRQQTHLQVGQLLQQGQSIDELSDEQCFAIVEQLNHARPLMSDPAELHQLMLLNLRAARQARAVSVWEAAADYAHKGIALLPDNAWQSCYDSARDLYLIEAECEYLSGHPEVADKYYETLFTELTDDLLRAEICANRLIQSIGRAQWVQGIRFGKQGLSYLGLPIPADDELESEFEKENQFLLEHSNDGLIEMHSLQEMTEKSHLMAVLLYSNLSTGCHLIGESLSSNYFAVKGCNLILKEGQSDLAAMQLGTYAFYLRRNGILELSFKQAQQAKLIADHYIPCREIANCYNLLALMIWYLKAPLEQCVAMHLKGYEFGMEKGEIARALISLCSALVPLYSKGESLELIKENALSTIELLNRKAVFHPAGSYMFNLADALLSGRVNAHEALNDEVFDTETIRKIRQSMHYTYLVHYRSQLAFWCGEDELAYVYCKEVESFGARLAPAILSVDHVFYNALLLIRRTQQFDENAISIQRSMQKMDAYAVLYPPNFEHKSLLLMAELGRRKKDSFEETSQLYHSAIESAKRNGFIQCQALACELFAEYWVEKGFETVAETYIRESLYLYRRWGCLVKVNALQDKYRQFLECIETRPWHHHSLRDSVASAANQTLDMSSVMKSAQLISRELQLSSLSARVLEVIMESAGGSSAALIINLDGVPHVVARVNEDGLLTIPDVPPRLEDIDGLPINIIRYVLNSDEMVNVGDVLTDRRFTNDPYLLKHQPRSVLCMPVDYRDTTFGALYLENSLTQGAFTPERMDVIKLLLAQAAISFDNAQLFKEVNELNQNLERKVDQRTAELNQAVRELQLTNEELNAFSYSVSHDLRSPLRSIRSFSQILKEGFGSALSAEGISIVDRIDRNGSKMQDLIDGLLELSRVQRQEMKREPVNLSQLVEEIFTEMRRRFPDQRVDSSCTPDCIVFGDKRMIYSAIENLISNAWKYSSRNPHAAVDFGVLSSRADVLQGVGLVPEKLDQNTPIYYVKDNGAGFDMSRADKLFGSFQRLHSEKEFSGTGVGLATVKRVFEKHGGYVWAQAKSGEGAIFYFYLPDQGR
ncbi:MAG: AAA family ATPase [Hahellaceae bacterium]|nr:AAA family ATPase [Hahellaceae bacterium]